LILDNDEVTLPGLGTFVSEVMPSTFSDKGYTINPPYRKLSFRQRGSGNELMLAEFYAAANGMDVETSQRILDEFISGLKTALQTKKMVVFPGLGRLRATKENTFFFIADEDLDIYPYGVALEPVSLKTHVETPEEVAQSVAVLKELIDVPVASVTEPTGVAGESVSESEISGTVENSAAVEKPVAKPAEETVPVEINTDSESLRQAQRPENEVQRPDQEETVMEETEELHLRKKRSLKVAAIVVTSLIGVALLALGIFILLAHIAPDFIDSILYTPEELRIINH
ncbi:MAG TPA: hypothetical protein DDX40_10250, partial [Rikenellaceae bacterium]|nr:hypothetical protein [Rikenellaceae bacterium]